jgi:acyl-CoA thioester hydrolase
LKKFQIPIQVRFRDLDAMGHVNNAVYFSYFELGRLEFFKNIIKVKSPAEFSFILAKSEASYYLPIDLASPNIILNMWAGEFGNKSFKFFYELVSEDNKLKFADGYSVQVFYNYKTKKTIPVPDDFKEKIKDYISH